MTLDIVPSMPVSQNTVQDGPSGASPPRPSSDSHSFAAMLAQHKPPAAGHSPGTSRKSSNETRENKTRSDQNSKHGDKDAASDQSLSNSSPSAVQTQPAPAPILPSTSVLPGPPVPDALVPNASLADTSETSEAMDTSLSGAAASLGAAAPISGGGLLPQTNQTLASAEGSAAAPLALPDAPAAPALASTTGLPTPAASAAQPGAAGLFSLTAAGAAQKEGVAAASPGAPTNLPNPAGPQTAKIASQGYAQFSQLDLQNAGRPANNTGKSKDGIVFPEAQAAGKSASLLSTILPAALPPALADLGQQAVDQWEQADQAKANDLKEKPAGDVHSASDALLMPAAGQAGDTTQAAAVSTAPLPPTDRAALMQQAADSMQNLHAQVLGHGQGQMTLQLHPQDWGKLQVSVTMTPDGKGTGGTLVTAHLVADSAAVKQALETGGADLRRTLREAGLHLESMTVTVRPPSASTEAQNMGGSQDGSPRQSASQDAQWSSGNNAPGTTAGNGQPAFGGGNTNSGTQNPYTRQATFLATGAADDYSDQTPPAMAAAATSGRLDTRA